MADDDRPGAEHEDSIRIVTAEELDDGDSVVRPPVIDLGAPSGEVQLPHWTAPATGQVPQVVLGTGVDPEAGSSADSVRWRDERDSSDDLDFLRDLGSLDPDEPVVERLGALDTSERTTDSDYLNFDDVELDPRKRGRARSRRPRATRPTAATEPRAQSPALASASASGSGGQASDGAEGSNGPGGRNVPLAAAVGAVMAVVALLAFSVGPVGALLIAEIVVAAAGVEFLTALQRNGFRPATLVGIVAIAVFPLAAYWKGEAAFPLVLALTLVVSIIWFVAGLGGRARPVANLGVTLLSVVWIGMFGAFAALLVDVPAEGVSLLLLGIVGTVGHDVGAFFIGRAAGRTPMSALSPNKTVEGLIGGMVGSIVAVFVVAVLLGVGPFSAGGALLLGIVIAFMAPLGDLAESLFKRDLGIKDMGTLLPQHGGILDRFDGMLFVLPTTYYVARLCGVAG
jgi:phosphatidate cytidylyltransferase